VEARNTHCDLFKDRWPTYTDEEIRHYISKGFFPNLTIGDLLDRNAANCPDKLAVVDDLKELTWKELREAADRLAVHLIKLGVEYGDFILLQLPNVVEFMVLYFALNRIGAIPVMSLPRHRRIEIEHQVSTHEAKGICVSVNEKFDFVSMIEEIRTRYNHFNVMLAVGEKAPEGWVSIQDLLHQAVEKEVPPDYLEPFKPVPTDICTEQLSGGTTGAPKGIPRTHNDYICGWDYVGRAAGYTDESISLVAIPVAHNGSMENICGPAIFRGGTIVLCNSPKTENIFRMIENYRVTHSLIVPVLLNYIRDEYELTKKYDLSSLEALGVGGQKSRPEMIEWCLNALGVHYVNTFGMAEGPQLTTRWHCSKDVQMYTVGRPVIDDCEARIKLVDKQNREVEPGEVGEMVMKGPLNFRGYFNDAEENEKAFDSEGFFHTGDLMSLRPDGTYVVEGRSKDTILRGGENVYPESVEDLVKEHPKVFNCAAIGMPDEQFGEKLCVVLETEKGKTISLSEILEYLKMKGLAVFQFPERLEIVERFPLTPVNKIDKRRLRAYVATKLYQEDEIGRELGDEYLRRDKISIDDVLSGRNVF
jgi:2,3-dihydroxybenzoate-AMP ligase